MALLPETYQRHRSTADRLITRYGGTAVLLQRGEQTGPDYAPEYGPDIETPVTYIETGYDITLHPDTAIQAGDVVGVMAVPSDVTPRPTDSLIVDGLEYRFMEMTPVQPSHDARVILFKFQARR